MNLHYLAQASTQALLAASQRVTQPMTTRLDGVNADMVADSASSYALQTVSMRAAASVQAWVETDDLASGEGSADRLFAMMVGIADENKDGELSEDEQAVVSTAMNEAWSYMSSKGVAESDLDLLFNSEDPAESNAAGDRVMEFLAGVLPDGDDASSDEMDDFAFGSEAQTSAFDAVYKKRFAIRDGKKKIIMKRVSGTVRLSAAQRVAIRKASNKAHGAAATAKRMKSLRKRTALKL